MSSGMVMRSGIRTIFLFAMWLVNSPASRTAARMLRKRAAQIYRAHGLAPFATFTGHWKGHALKPLRIKAKQGIEILHDPLYNKGTAFEPGERDRLNLRGLLPPRSLDFQTQVDRIMKNLRAQGDDMRKNIYLLDLHDRNETLFHRVLVDNFEELAPIVYTPTVGRVCQEFGQLFRRPRGMYFSTLDRGQFAAMIYNWPGRDVHVIVVTDGSRILGLGDLGANGMGIPIGKLALYCAAGGIAPHRVLPVVLDCGTNNKRLLEDPFYLGVQQPRLRGPEFYDMVDEFIDAVRGRFPHALIQFEDFSSDVAYEILEKYKDTSLCFNDDIQGTGSVTLAGILSAMKNQGKAPEMLREERILIAGAGSAGIGVASMLLQGMVEQGMNRDRAKKNFWVCDKDGLLGKARKDSLTPQQAEFARDDLLNGLSLLEVAKAVKPTVLLGLSAVRGLFTEDLVKEVAKYTIRPFIFPLSNPTSSAECTAAEAYLWTEGRAIFASGSPFAPVTIHDKTYRPSQCNNMFIFPGLGLGATVAGAHVVTSKMMYACSEALASALTPEERADGRVFPQVKRIREVSLKVAVAAAQSAINDKISRHLSPSDFPYLESIIARKMYDPVYVPLVQDIYKH